MAKDKKKHSKKDKASEDILDVAAVSLKKFRKVTKQISKLSTGQKVVGGLALAAAGLVYLTTRETDDAPAGSKSEDPAEGADDDEAATATESASSRHRRKAAKHRPEE